jgi:oxysterol-binding protein 1
LALSLLHRDKTKNDGINDDAGSAHGSDEQSSPESPTAALSSHHSFSHLRTSRHKLNGSSHRANERGGLEATSPIETTSTRDNPPLKPQDVAPTIEQSVRLFKLFEVLQSGDSVAIAKAVKEASDMPPIQENSQPSTSTTGALDGTTILHLAIQCASPAVVEEILLVVKSTPGVSLDLNARDRDGNTPLHLASMLGRASTVRLLLEQPETNDYLLDFQGRSPLDLARTPEISQQLQLSRSLFIDTKTKEIHELLGHKDYDRFQNLLEDIRVEMAMDVNSGELATEPNTIQSGGTLLHEAARNKDTKLIQLLLLHGADPFRRDRKGRLPQDVTKDERTRAILKKSPAAAAAQRGIQERAVLGNSSSATADSLLGGKDGREMKGYLKKWTNYTTGYKLRWFVLEDGVLSYYKHQGSSCNFIPSNLH